MTAVLLLIPFLIEGIGGLISRQYLIYIFSLILVGLSLYIFIKRKPINLPLKITIIYFCFIFFSLISVFYSVNRQVSFELVLFYNLSFLFFIFFYNFKDQAKRFIKLLLVIGSIVFTAISIYFRVFNKFPDDGFQLVSSLLNASHNHLGDFLGLAIIILFYYIFNRKPPWFHWLLIGFTPFFILSYSRSAYFSLIVVLLVILFKNAKNKLLSLKTGLILTVVSIVLIFFFATVNEAKNNRFTNDLNNYLTNHFSLKSKDFTSSRLTYISQGLVSLKDNFLFGVGPGNYGFLSRKYSLPGTQWYDLEPTESAHSLLPEILFENGFFAFFFFTLFVILLIPQALKKNQLEGYLFLYLILNFQSDYTYRIYSMFILMFIFAACFYEEKNSKISKLLFPVSTIIILLINLAILTSQILFKFNFSDLSAKIYPLNNEAIKSVIVNKVKKNCEETDKLVTKLYNNSPGELSTLQFLSSYYEHCQNERMAIYMLDQAYLNNKFLNLDIVKKDYLMRKDVYGVESASNFLKLVLRKYGSLRNIDYFSNQVYDFCIENGDLACQEESFGAFKYFYEPDPKDHKKILKQVPYPESYTINKDALNERHDYSEEKPQGVYRIVVLGGSETFGLLIKTKDNWTEKLEDLLGKKIEVINLAVNGYDIPYEVERFRRRGVKYQPDLVLWYVTNGSFKQFNEVMSEKSKKITETMEKSGQLKQEIARGNYYAAYEKAYDETKLELKDKFPNLIGSFFQSIRNYYSGRIIFVGPVIEEENEKLISDVFGKNKVYFKPIYNLDDKQYRFPLYDQLDERGHQMIAEEVADYLKQFIYKP